LLNLLPRSTNKRIPNSIQVLIHVVIQNPQNAYSKRPDHCVAALVVFLTALLVVTFTVQLNRQLDIGGIEIDGIRFDSVLPTEFATKELAILQYRPEDGFCGRHAGPQIPAGGFRLRFVELARHGRDRTCILG
jgi:hypothetical protein